jgi:2-octaprenyl-3-methyl-6-methoxy-1,4-benzoquinol hydroxylase
MPEDGRRMSRRARIDVAIVGGGVVGSACALALAQLGLDVALVEASEPPAWSANGRDLRVYAFAPDNAALLERLDIWRAVREARVQPYRRMRVWDAAGGDELAFDADALGRSELGWIVEHGLLADRLWRALSVAGVDLRCPARLQACTQDEAGVRLELDDGARIDARVAVAADGADSSVRRLLGIDLDARDYGQRGVVCFVSSERPHQDTAWQRFLPGGPLALLPFADDPPEAQRPPGRICSIVWSLPEDEARRILSLDDDAFARELDLASDLRLGALHLDSPRVGFPLRRQLARDYLRGRVLLLGDAAHVVHPLAGQGVNLGLRDVAALARLVEQAQARRADFASPQRLLRWARQRRSENAMAAHAFEAIHRLYTDDGMAATLLRGHLLGIAGRLPPVAYRLWRHAAGL